MSMYSGWELSNLGSISTTLVQNHDEQRGRRKSDRQEKNLPRERKNAAVSWSNKGGGIQQSGVSAHPPRMLSYQVHLKGENPGCFEKVAISKQRKQVKISILRALSFRPHSSR